MMGNFSMNAHQGKTWFWGGSFLISLLIILAVLMDVNYLLGIPFLLIYLFFSLYDFTKIYLLLLFILPLSKEFELPGGLAIDLPGEPILISLLGVFILHVVSKKRIDKEFVSNPIIQVLGIHILWIFITIFYSQEIVISSKFFLAKIWHVIPFVFVTGLIIKNETQFKKPLWIVLISSSIAIVTIIIIHATTGFAFDTINSSCSVFFRNHVNYAAFISLLVPFIWLAGAWYPKGTNKKFIVLLLKILFLVSIYFAYARGAWLALFAAVGFYYLLKYRLLKYAVAFGTACFIFILFHLTEQKKYLEYSPDFERAIYHRNLMDHLKATIKNQDISTVERFYRWISGSRMWQDHAVTGFGPGSFYHYYKRYTVRSFTTYVSDNPERSGVHNYFLMTLVEQGIIGFIIFICLTFTIFYKGVWAFHKAKEQKRKLFIAAILCSLVIIYTQLMLSDLIETIKIGGFYFINIALLVNQITFLKKQQLKEAAA